MYEGEQEGPLNVAHRLIGKAIRTLFVNYFPDPQSFKQTARNQQKGKAKPNPYQPVIDWFGKGNELLLLQDDTDEGYRNSLYQVDGLYSVVKQYYPDSDTEQTILLMEFVLHGLAEFSLISKRGIDGGGYNFGDILGSMMNINMSDMEDDEEEDDF